jgi:hypothetical protein
LLTITDVSGNVSVWGHMVPETSCDFQLTQIITREDFIKVIRHESISSHIRPINILLVLKKVLMLKLIYKLLTIVYYVTLQSMELM